MLVGLVGPGPRAGPAPAVEPITFTVRFPAPDKHIAEVEASYPTDGRESIELMLPIWTPGFYRVENYAGQVQDLSARTPDRQALTVEQPKKNRWTVQTGGAKRVVVSYTLKCESRSVTTNWVGEDMAVLNGAATFLTLVETGTRPHDIRLELAANWKRSMTGLDAAPDGRANHYRGRELEAVDDRSGRRPGRTGEPLSRRRFRHPGGLADRRRQSGGPRVRGGRLHARRGERR
jgi:predicted metalloprotease with PDZ domain